MLLVTLLKAYVKELIQSLSRLKLEIQNQNLLHPRTSQESCTYFSGTTNRSRSNPNNNSVNYDVSITLHLNLVWIVAFIWETACLGLGLPDRRLDQPDDRWIKIQPTLADSIWSFESRWDQGSSHPIPCFDASSFFFFTSLSRAEHDPTRIINTEKSIKKQQAAETVS